MRDRRTMRWGRAWLAGVAIVAAAGISAAPAAASHGRATAALGPCWLTNLGFGIGEDTHGIDYVARWQAGRVQTLIQGQAPHARYWSLTLYHARHGQMLTLYDRQIVSGGRGTFRIAIGGPRPHGHTLYLNPTAGGGDAEGYAFFRVYSWSGATPAPPSVSYSSSGALPATLSTCAKMSADLRTSLQAANRQSNAQTKQVGASAKNKLWPSHADPYGLWSVAVDPAQVVPASDVTQVGLVTQLADPNVNYHVILFNMTRGDLVFYGTLPPISARAPASGVRYVSLCAYPNNESHTPLACLDDAQIKTDSHHHYVVVVSPDQPSDGENWLNVGNTNVGDLVLRWVLPQGGVKSGYCLPSLMYRQPGDTGVPPLPSGC